MVTAHFQPTSITIYSHFLAVVISLGTVFSQSSCIPAVPEQLCIQPCWNMGRSKHRFVWPILYRNGFHFVIISGTMSALPKIEMAVLSASFQCFLRYPCLRSTIFVYCLICTPLKVENVYFWQSVRLGQFLFMVPSHHNSKQCSQGMLLSSLYLYASIFFDQKSLQCKWKELTANEHNGQ